MCPSVGAPLASTASPSFVQRSNRESSASSPTWSRKLSSFGFVRFDIGVKGMSAACLRECQKTWERFDTVCTVFPPYFQSTVSDRYQRSVRGNQRVCNGMHGECDPILHPNLAHQLGYVRLDRALPDAQWGADFLVRSPFHQHL